MVGFVSVGVGRRKDRSLIGSNLTTCGDNTFWFELNLGAFGENPRRLEDALEQRGCNVVMDKIVHRNFGGALAVKGV